MRAKRNGKERGAVDATAGFGRNAAVFAALLAFAITVAAPAAQRTSIQLPPDNPHAQLKPGPGEEVTSRACSICHSTDYIVVQPHLDAQHWDAEVQKMIKVFGAPITPSDAKIISDYLARNYASEGGNPPTVQLQRTSPPDLCVEDFRGAENPIWRACCCFFSSVR